MRAVFTGTTDLRRFYIHVHKMKRLDLITFNTKELWSKGQWSQAITRGFQWAQCFFSASFCEAQVSHFLVSSSHAVNVDGIVIAGLVVREFMQRICKKSHSNWANLSVIISTTTIKRKSTLPILHPHSSLTTTHRQYDHDHLHCSKPSIRNSFRLELHWNVGSQLTKLQWFSLQS